MIWVWLILTALSVGDIVSGAWLASEAYKLVVTEDTPVPGMILSATATLVIAGGIAAFCFSLTMLLEKLL